MPSDRRLRPIAAELLKNGLRPVDRGMGRRVGASGRTLARLFIAETGLSFTRWRTQCRLLLARARLAEGESVTTVAHAMGYASDSAFIATPTRRWTPPGRVSWTPCLTSSRRRRLGPCLPMPSDRRLRPIAAELVEELRPVDRGMGGRVGASGRTLAPVHR